MKRFLPLLLALPLLACGDSGPVAPANTVIPDLNVTGETPGDWSTLRGAVGRTPADSALLTVGPIATDLNAMLGKDSAAFHEAMNDAGPLRAEPNGILVSRSASGRAWLVIQPADHAIAAGLLAKRVWRTLRTPASEVPIPPDLRPSVQSSPVASSTR